MGLAQSKPTSTQQFNIVITNLKCMNISLKCKCDAMHEHLGSFTQNRCNVMQCMNICVLRHSKIEMSNIIGYFFSLSNKPMYDILKRRICKEKSKAKRSKMLLNMIASVYSRRCKSYRMYLEGDSPHQAVMIVCELKQLSHISNRHNIYTLMQSCDILDRKSVV